MNKFMGISTVALVAGGVAVNDAAQAQLDEIIVTAQKREQNLQDVPVAVTAFGTEDLVRTGTDELNDLVAITPGLSGRNQGVASAVYAIRGINSNSFGVGGDNSVGIFVDDVFIGRQAISSIGFLDVERIEVLKGPQGTLFGRNSTAGAISIVSKRPGDEFEGEARVSYGNLQSLEAFAGVSIPIVEDKLAIRVAGLRREEDGTQIDVVNGLRYGDNSLWAGRATVVWNVTDSLTIEGFYARWRQETSGTVAGTTVPALVGLAPGSSADPFDRRVAVNGENFEIRDADVAGLTLNYNVNDDLAFKSITSFTRLDDQGVADGDGSIVPFFSFNFGPDVEEFTTHPGLLAAESGKTIGQEFRLNGTTDSLDWLVGLSYFGETVDEPRTFRINEVVTLGGTPIAANSLGFPHPAFAVCDATSDAIFGVACNPDLRESDLTQGDYKSYAVFGDVRWSATDNLTLTLGLRYSYDEKEFSITSFIDPGLFALLGGNGTSAITPNTFGLPVVQKNDWSDLQPRFVADYRWNDEILTYASVSRGFKAGGFDTVLNIVDSPFDEEEVWAYEVGLKSNLFGDRVVLNGAVYYNDYEQLQVQTIVNGFSQTLNVPTVENYGFEFEMLAQPTENFVTNLGVAFNESKFGTFVTDTGDLEGNRPPLTPRWTINVGAQYTHNLTPDVDVYLRGNADYRSREFESIENTEILSQEGLWLVNGRLAFANPDSHWEVAGFAKNLLDKDNLIYTNDFGFGRVAIAAPPRRYGVEVRAKF